ncbi:MAG TPA: hypothetical protein VGF17_15020, partial [Phytomonospora sp.]
VLGHPETVVRAAALRLASGYRAWTGLRDALEARLGREIELAGLVGETLSHLSASELRAEP